MNPNVFDLTFLTLHLAGVGGDSLVATDEGSFFWPKRPASECDFENGSCGWSDLTPGDGFDWVRGTPAEVPTHYFGNPAPPDHSTNSSEGATTHIGRKAKRSRHSLPELFLMTCRYT